MLACELFEDSLGNPCVARDDTAALHAQSVDGFPHFGLKADALPGAFVFFSCRAHDSD